MVSAKSHVSENNRLKVENETRARELAQAALQISALRSETTKQSAALDDRMEELADVKAALASAYSETAVA